MKIMEETAKEHGIMLGVENVFQYLHEFEDHSYEQLTLPF